MSLYSSADQVQEAGYRASAYTANWLEGKTLHPSTVVEYAFPDEEACRLPRFSRERAIPATTDRLTCPGARDNLGCKIIRSRWLMRKRPAGTGILCCEKDR
jgi:hypothetical protein